MIGNKTGTWSAPFHILPNAFHLKLVDTLDLVAVEGRLILLTGKLSWMLKPRNSNFFPTMVPTFQFVGAPVSPVPGDGVICGETRMKLGSA